MAGRESQANEAATRAGGIDVHILIIDAPYYEHISDALLAGATAELKSAGATWERVAVQGALEIPQALAQAVKAGLIPADARRARFDGCIALGCVIRGETSHYETVCNNANHWLMDIATRNGVPIGNAILTVENEAQALERAGGGRKGKGADAARACLTLIRHANAFAKATE